MPFPTNSSLFTWDTGGTLCSLAASLANNAWMYSGLSGLTLTEYAPTDIPAALELVLGIIDTFAAAPTAGGGANIWFHPTDTDGNDDDAPAPDAVALKTARFVGFIPIPAYDVAFRGSIIVPGDLYRKGYFLPENKCGQTWSYSSNPITLKSRPGTWTPKT